MFRPIFSACVVALLAAISPVAQAQSQFGGGTSAFGGGFGSGGFGSSSGFGSSGFGGSGFGGGGLGGSGFGSSGFGGSGFGSSSSGMGGFGGSGGSSFGNQGFGGGGYGGGQNFVGRDAADMTAVWNQMGEAGSQFFNQMNRNMSRGNRSERSAQTIDNPPQVMRVNLQIAFTSQRPAPEVVVDNLRARLGRILASQNIALPEVTTDGEVVVLRGVALTDSQRLVFEKLIALEPGVRAVRNEMTVIPQAAMEAVPEAGN